MDVSLSLSYRDPGAAIDWLERAFAFERGMVMEDAGRIAHAELFHGDSCVMLGAVRPDGLGQPPGSGWAYVVVDDTDAHATTPRATPRATSGTSGRTGRAAPRTSRVAATR